MKEERRIMSQLAKTVAFIISVITLILLISSVMARAERIEDRLASIEIHDKEQDAKLQLTESQYLEIMLILTEIRVDVKYMKEREADEENE